MATRTISNAGGNWNDTASWTEGAVPTAADDVVATGTSGNLTINVAANCRSFDLANYTATLAHNASTTLFIGDGTPGANNIALRFSSGMTYTLGNVVNSGISYAQSHTTQQTIDTAGKLMGGATFSGVSNVAPNWLLSSSYTTSSAAAGWTHQRGNINTNNQTVSIGMYASTTNFSGGRSLTLGSSTITIRNTSGTPWNLLATGHSVSAGTSTIVLSDTGATGKTFAGGGVTYNNLSITTGGAGSWTITGSNTFTRLLKTGSSTKTIIFTAGTTTTLTGGIDAFFSGQSGNLITIQSSSAGSVATISKSSGIVSSDYISLKDSTATGGADFYAGANSTDVSGNTGWTFSGPPLTTQDIAIDTSTDNTTIEITTTEISGNDIAVGLSADNTTITQLHALTASDIAVGTTIDDTTIQETNFVIASQDSTVALSADNATISQNHILSTDDIAFNLTTDADTITQNQIIVTQDVAVATSLDTTDLVHNYVLSTSDISTSTSLGSTTLNQLHVIASNDITHATSLDNTALTQNHIVTSSDVAIATTTDEATTMIFFTIPSEDMALTTRLDATTINQNHVITPSDIAFSLTADDETVTQTNFSLVAQDVSLSALLDNATITQNQVIATQGVTTTTRLDNVTLPTLIEGRDYYIDTDGNIYWVVNQQAGILEPI